MTDSGGSVELRERRQILLLAFGAFALVFILWQTASDSFILYPFRLLVTFVHEAGHGLSAIFTGGRFLRFEVFPSGAGVARTAGGTPLVVLQMGYLGAALFGAVLLYLTNRVRRARLVAVVLGLFFIGCALLFTGSGGATLVIGVVIAGALFVFSGEIEKRSVRNARYAQLAALGVLVVTLLVVRNNVALVVGIIAGTIIIALGAFASRLVTIFALNALALIVGFNALNDILGLWNNTDAMLGSVPNDALATARLTNLPVQLWILVWIGLAVVMMGISIYFALIRAQRE